MNATTENRVLTPEEAAGEVHEVFGRQGAVALVSPEDRKAHYARILERQEADRKAEHKRATNRWWREAAMAGTVVALAVGIAAMMPLKRLMPVFVHFNQADGTWNSSVGQNDLTPSQRAATIKSTMWLYTTSREKYVSATHFNIDQQIVYMLSDKATGDAYEKQVNVKNKESPWVKYGTRKTVRLERISETLSCATQECDRSDPDVYQVRYRRVERTEGQGEVARQWTSTIRFRVVPQIPAWQQTTYNPLNLQVVEYVPQEEGAGQ